MIGWVNIGILAGLAALAVPVVIHLLRSRQFQVADIGTLRFLREAVEESARWRRLRDLLLLLLRLLAVALLTCLFARPFFTHAGSMADRDEETVVLVDVSGSMAGRLLGGTAWDYARRRVNEVLGELPNAARVTLAAFAGNVREIRNWKSFKPVPGGKTDYAKALRWARDRLKLSTARHRQVVLVTDLQASGLPAIRPPAWPADIPVRIVPVPRAGDYNVGIAEVHCVTPYPKDKAVVRVRLATSGKVPNRSVKLVLQPEHGNPVSATVPLAAQTVEFRIPAKPGICEGTVRLETDDEYPRDNQRPFAFQLRNPAPVLLVDGHPGKTPFQSETYYLEKALETARNDEGKPAYSVSVRTGLPPLSAYQAVVLCNVASFSDTEARAMAEFVNLGGGLMIFLGDRCEPQAYERLRRFGAFPLTFRRKAVPVPSPWISWNTQHPALEAFGGRQNGDLSRIVFRDAFAIRPRSKKSVLARLASGMPALLASTFGAGRVVVVTNPCTREWSNWPAERIFLPLVRELMLYARHARGGIPPVIERFGGVDETRKPGVYQDGKSVLVVAPSPDEIDVAPCSEKDFREALALPPAPPDTFHRQTAGLPPDRERKNEIWRWLAVALIAALLVENVLADKGRPRSSHA